MTDTADVTAATPHGEEIHHTHRDVNGGWLRPAVFGAMDGVVSNGALVVGVAAASASTHDVLLTGFAGLLAGSFSMAIGEWTSVTSQAELVQTEIAKEILEIARSPKAEEAELAAMLKHRGLSRDLADKVAREVSANPDEAWRTHVREELGVDPDEQPSPYIAGFSSFVTFALGALVPLVPYFFGASHVVWSLILVGIALLSMGGAAARFTGRSPWFPAVRHLTLGAVAIAIVYGVGHAIGTGVSG